jgi:hypothetical protein
MFKVDGLLGIFRKEYQIPADTQEIDAGYFLFYWFDSYLNTGTINKNM